MSIRKMLIVACCLAPTSLLAANPPNGPEVIPTPAHIAPAGVAAAPFAEPDNAGCEAPGTPTPKPWWYWFYATHGRGQHYAYLPPLPGWYYFRPYSVAQLAAQQQAAVRWGGDARNPYAPLPDFAADVIQWPLPLRGPRFAEQRARVEAPYRREGDGRANPDAADYLEMIDAAAKMKALLRDAGTAISPPERETAEKFLDKLAAEAEPYRVAQLRAERKTVAEPARGSQSIASTTKPREPIASTASPLPTATVTPATGPADLIRWPSLLRDSRFAEYRSTIEAPYRHDRPGGSHPTTNDFQNMIDAAAQMRTVLGRMAAEISPRDRANAEQFLDRLAAEAAPYAVNAIVQQQPSAPGDVEPAASHGSVQPIATSAADGDADARATGYQAATAEPAAVADDVIPWPELLRNKRLAAQRAKIEAPYRRDTMRPSNPAAADYQNMLDGIEEMRGILRQNLGDISMQDYRDAQKFLDQLAAEVQQRLDASTSGRAGK